MFVDKLRMAVTAQQNAKIVKPCDDALKLHTINQENCKGYFLLPDVVEKCILEALNFVCGHFIIPIVCFRRTKEASFLPLFSKKFERETPTFGEERQ